MPYDIQRLPTGPGGLFYGVYPAVVTDLQDPDGQGRVKIRLPWTPDTGAGAYEVWARVAVLMAGNGRGTWFIPDVDDEVLVAFEAGNPDRPYVVGGLWNGQDSPPETMDDDNTLKVIHSRNGIRIAMEDRSGQETLTLETPGGQKMTYTDSPAAIEITDSSGNSIKLESSGITITASGNVTINAAKVAVSASMVTVDAGMSKFSGVVQCDTLIATSVVGASYTPGAGNMW
ncbi:MAG: type IV secretion protein Rhs [Candidatus Promineofilum sp.]|jgi:uncharacterized protein involved in type VI secretion and phage assembly|nr:type IV secretion protein Rhs [Promineifilum sp.]